MLISTACRCCPRVADEPPNRLVVSTGASPPLVQPNKVSRHRDQRGHRPPIVYPSIVSLFVLFFLEWLWLLVQASVCGEKPAFFFVNTFRQAKVYAIQAYTKWTQIFLTVSLIFVRDVKTCAVRHKQMCQFDMERTDERRRRIKFRRNHVLCALIIWQCRAGQFTVAPVEGRIDGIERDADAPSQRKHHATHRAQGGCL